MKLNRVVVTGYGVTSPIGNTPEEFWNSLATGKIGIGGITKFDHSDFDVHNAAEIQDFPFDKYFVKKIPTVLITILYMPCMQPKRL
ncbi:3-oxoacyl-[acyl-carrier-] synthase 2 domain protein [Streptococcus pneumoniae GA18523]|nr:3-oxoacyl-(acyl carrier protein) synthase II [Streptococcus pneumoniae SP9-BS68]EHD72338.1 3-oxoacyl-[acyl-carrier-] synthase 2 domain protein [Streptococcus pneumoniae GA18523]EHE06122.1 3-oxoacyl-(Acyl-carrier-) synthase II domain protein [Streptococcus pneumoniae GA16833]EHE12263.1 3-oxoacyl-(Acyl-carrier-) synthase II domain protein [Streptococcus pneumoniae GA17971]EHE45779.1 3-oxoacyl-(Acyl-carrier-) synthase II domain protein [Streptococcus pneumoniae GA47778]EHE74885.1 3-oxoacyl-[ac